MGIQSEIAADISVVIENEKRELTRECFEEVWEELADESVNPLVVAEIFIGSALKRLASACGEDETTQMIEHFRLLNEMGFLPDRGPLQ